VTAKLRHKQDSARDDSIAKIDRNATIAARERQTAADDVARAADNPAEQGGEG
jgi:hypothetical protein